jgi:hypothetical protein
MISSFNSSFGEIARFFRGHLDINHACSNPRGNNSRRTDEKERDNRAKTDAQKRDTVPAENEWFWVRLGGRRERTGTENGLLTITYGSDLALREPYGGPLQ